MKFGPWTASMLPSMVRFWNRSFSGKRNFHPMTEALFRERVLGRETAFEHFDPSCLIVARDGRELAGFIHVGVRPEAQCRSLDPEWRSGSQGYVGFLFVDPARRRRGLGTELWHRGLQAVKKTRQVVIDGQCFNPFYGNSEGPFTPFWGTPEGVCVDWNDSPTKKFLARKGFAPRIKGVQLALDLTGYGGSVAEQAKKATRLGVDLRVVWDSYPELGKSDRARRPLPAGLEYDVVVAVRRKKVVGLISYFPMKEVRQGLYGVYEAVVVPALRGRALSKRLLSAALARMKELGGSSCEVLTLPELSPAAHKLYQASGFVPVQNWAIY